MFRSDNKLIMKVTVASVSDTGVFSFDVSEDLEIENFKVLLVYLMTDLLLPIVFLSFLTLSLGRNLALK